MNEIDRYAARDKLGSFLNALLWYITINVGPLPENFHAWIHSQTSFSIFLLFIHKQLLIQLWALKCMNFYLKKKIKELKSTWKWVQLTGQKKIARIFPSFLKKQIHVRLHHRTKSLLELYKLSAYRNTSNINNTFHYIPKHENP